MDRGIPVHTRLTRGCRSFPGGGYTYEGEKFSLRVWVLWGDLRWDLCHPLSPGASTSFRLAIHKDSHPGLEKFYVSLLFWL